MKRFYLTILIVLQLTACQNDNFETPYYDQKIVVDGWIEPNQPARVFLTLSAPYFSEVDSSSLRNLVITRAKVTVIDGLNEEILTLRTNYDYFPPYIYEGTYLRGIIGHSYSLKVEYGGVTVTSTTQIPDSQQLDSLWFKRAPDIDTAGYIMIKFSDKPGIDNFYRILTRTGVNTKKYTPVFLPNLDGRLIDGQTVSLTLSNEKKGDIILFNVNDTVTVKFCTMEQSAFKFWNSLYSDLNNTQNPFASTSSHVISNVSGGLGVWAGYGVNTYRIVCK